MDKAQWQANLREWQRLYGAAHQRAERIAQMRNDRARRACAEAGLSPDLLGIHPHNAMCDFRSGRPWPGVNYSKVRFCLRLCNLQWEGFRILERYNTRIWNRLMVPVGAPAAA